MKVGFFDSGIGGFSILKEFLQDGKGLEVYYYADDAHNPYGKKSDQFIIERAKEITNSFYEMGIRLVVVACNTATAIAIEALREKYNDVTFVGVEPYINVINKQVFSIDDRISVITTELMGKSPRFLGLKSRLDKDNRIAHHSMPNLANLIENAFYNGLQVDLENELMKEISILKEQNYSHVILGCTHYPLIRNFIEEKIGIECLSPCSQVSKRIWSLIGECDSNANNRVLLYRSTENVWQDIDESQLTL